MLQTNSQVSVYRTVGPLIYFMLGANLVLPLIKERCFRDDWVLVHGVEMLFCLNIKASGNHDNMEWVDLRLNSFFFCLLTNITCGGLWFNSPGFSMSRA